MRYYTQRIAAAAMAAVMVTAMATGCSDKGTETKEKQGFAPKLDQDADVQLDMVGYFGNFEALDQVMNDFNQYYPNVTYTYEQVGGDSEEAYMDANPGVDIIMTSREFLNVKDSTLAKRCVNLSEQEIDFDDIDSQMLKDTCIDGKQLAIPMGQNIYGIVVNESLLEKEGLSVPKNRDEFVKALATLKEKGYTPIQGPTSKIYAELTENIVLSGLCEDQPLEKALEDGDMDAAEEAIQPAMDMIDELVTNGYTDNAVNDTYPEDNYDEAILRFFEGDVPFWVCNTEKVSGMKKRESKSESFQNDPFTYSFIYAPTGEEGEYIYREPWFGFAANVDGDDEEYAVEFLRFLATKDEINQMADVKGIPSVAKESTNPDIYEQVLSDKSVKNSCVNDGTITPNMVNAWYTCATKYANGEYATAEDAMKEYIDVCEQEIK